MTPNTITDAQNSLISASARFCFWPLPGKGPTHPQVGRHLQLGVPQETQVPG